MSNASKRLVNVALLFAAFWPVFAWYAARSLDKSDQPWGLLSLITALIILIGSKKHSHQNQSSETSEPSEKLADTVNLSAGIAVVAAYMLTYSIAPNLVQAVLLVLAIWFLLVSKMPSPSRPGIFGLLVLSLPLVPSLNFFLGYPLRILVAIGTCFMLSNLGLPATREGVMISLNGHLTAIDAPCSGINMLWTEFYVAMLLACKFKLNLKQTTILTLVSVPAILLGNILRASTLILFDRLAETSSLAGVAQYEPSVHLGAGLLCFSAVCGLTVFMATAIASRSEINEVHTEKSMTKKIPPLCFDKSIIFSEKMNRKILVALCMVAAILPVISRPISSMTPIDAPPIWPSEINGNKVIPVESLTEEKAFASDFPGQMKRFTDGTNSYFVRYVKRETRQLHPSSDCFKGLGYTTETHPIVVGRDNVRWGAFEASKANSRYLILERIYDATGQSSTDVSEWYWLAALGKTHGPWFDITIAQPLPLQNSSSTK